MRVSRVHIVCRFDTAARDHVPQLVFLTQQYYSNDTFPLVFPQQSPNSAMSTPLHGNNVHLSITLETITACPPKDRDALAKRLTKLEKKMFASNEAFDYTLELAKKSIGVILASYPSSPTTLIGYLVFQRQKGTTWLHKLAVIEAERGKGVAKRLLERLVEVVKKGGGRNVVLWVDEGNAVARWLYGRCGFEEGERVEGYYGEGRAGVKMELEMEG